MAKMNRRQLRKMILEQMVIDRDKYDFETNQGVNFLLMSRRDATRVMGDLRVPDDLRKLANAIEDAEKAAVLQDLVLEID
jgi:hypothetical protein